MDYVTATRPWSFTAVGAGILVGSALSYNSCAQFTLSNFLITVFGGLFIHASSNLFNTYFDFTTGLDRRDTADDRTLFDLQLSPRQVKMMALSFLGLATLIGAYVTLTMPSPSQSFGIFIRLLVGAFLGVFYTATPLSLKAVALGDLAIILCFGPLLVESIFYIHTNHHPAAHASSHFSFAAALFSLPSACVVEAILHANNTRDIKADLKAGAITFASMIGPDANFYVFCALIGLSYLSTAYIYVHYAVGVRGLASLLPLCTAPMALALVRKFRAADWRMLCPETAQCAFLVGLLHAVGILIGNVAI